MAFWVSICSGQFPGLPGISSWTPKNMICCKFLSKVRGLFCTTNRQLDFTTCVKPHEDFPDSPTAFTTATTTATTTAVSGGQQHQIELLATTNVVFMKPLGFVQYNVAEAQMHPTVAWLRNDFVPIFRTPTVSVPSSSMIS